MMVVMMLVHCNKFIAAHHPHHHTHTLNPAPLPSWLFQRAWCTARMHLQMQLQHAWHLPIEEPCPPGAKISGYLCDSVSLYVGLAFGGQHSPIVERIAARWHVDSCQLCDASEMKRGTHIPRSQKNFPCRFLVIVFAC